MTISVERIRRGVWAYRQPITFIPSLPGGTISDLFIWRKSSEWKTYFELIDIVGLFSDGIATNDSKATLIVLDAKGRAVAREALSMARLRRTTIELSHYADRADSEFGTFCVFHARTPDAVAQLGSFITERGYTSYEYHGGQVRSYVHGNLDAVSLRPDGEIELLGGMSFLRREYKLQFDLGGQRSFELFFVNPSPKRQNIECQISLAASGNVVSTHKMSLPPAGCDCFHFDARDDQSALLIVKSKLVMARPLLFSFDGESIDVFHG